MKLVACRASYSLGVRIAQELSIPLIGLDVYQFEDREVCVHLKEFISNDCVIVVQSTCPPANDNLIELLLTIDAVKRSGAPEIITVLPYYGYARQDRIAPGQPLSAQLIANLLVTAGATQVVGVDWHSHRLKSFFTVPAHELSPYTLFSHFYKTTDLPRDVVIVSPDEGARDRAQKIATTEGLPLAVIHKKRGSLSKNHVTVESFSGSVKGRPCLIVDDLIDSGGTLFCAVQALYDRGASRVQAYITHGLFSGQALERLDQSPVEQLCLTDSIPQPLAVLDHPKIRVQSIAKPLAEFIKLVIYSQLL